MVCDCCLGAEHTPARYRWEPPMLLVENVKKSYREPSGERLPILNVPRLELAAGEQVVIRGQSGGGKTTLLNVIAGLATADEGRILIQNTEVTRLPEAARDRF